MDESRPLVIIGGGGFAREVIWLARDCSEGWSPIAILDDDLSMHGKLLCNVPITGSIGNWTDYADASFVVAIGTPRVRKAIVERMSEKGNPTFATLIHPHVARSQYVTVGTGSILTAGCILTTQVVVGNHVIINLSTTVGHDASLGDFSTVAPRVAISGNVSVGDGAEIGTGAVIIQGTSIGSGGFVGAGAVVTKDVPANVLVAGAPARHVRTLEAFCTEDKVSR